jgi:hypothetical protein
VTIAPNAQKTEAYEEVTIHAMSFFSQKFVFFVPIPFNGQSVSIWSFLFQNKARSIQEFFFFFFFFSSSSTSLLLLLLLSFSFPPSGPPPSPPR